MIFGWVSFITWPDYLLQQTHPYKKQGIYGGYCQKGLDLPAFFLYNHYYRTSVSIIPPLEENDA